MLTFLRRIPAYGEGLRFKLYPKLAQLRLHFATRRARRALAETQLRILVDNSVLGWAITHETKWVSTGQTSWGTQLIDTGYAARVPVYSKRNRSPEFLQIKYLTGIAHLARLGLIDLFLSAELNDEQFRQPNGRFHGYGLFDYSLFAGIKMESVDGWVIPTLGPSWMELPSAAQQQRQRLAASDDPLYRALYDVLSKQLGPKCSQDVWHIRTAEKHGMFCFLTMDMPLLLAFKSLRKREPLRSLRTLVMSPADLADHLKLSPVSPHILSYNDASWFVRMDQTMPGERRRRRRDYRA